MKAPGVDFCMEGFVMENLLWVELGLGRLPLTIRRWGAWRRKGQEQRMPLGGCDNLWAKKEQVEGQTRNNELDFRLIKSGATVVCWLVLCQL